MSDSAPSDSAPTPGDTASPQSPGNLGLILLAIYLVMNMLIPHVWRVQWDDSFIYVWCRFAFMLGVIPYLFTRFGRDTMLLVAAPPQGKSAWGLLGLIVATLVVRLAWELYRPSHGFSPTPENFRAIALVAPVNEELVFRAIILGVMVRFDRIPAPQAIAISALGFAGIHDEDRFMLALSAGVLYGIAYLRSGKVLVAIALHILWNCVSFYDWLSLIKGHAAP